MAYLPHTDAEVRQMLQEIGVSDIQEFFNIIPNELMLSDGALNIPEAHSEIELVKKIKQLSIKNKSADSYPTFLGGGIYDHYIPVVVDALSSRGEFLTAYTPYQAEASQGTLQAIFEYQTAISRLVNMEVSNASLYDGSSALAEALLMAVNSTKKKRVILSKTLHPEYIEVARTYMSGYDVEMVLIDERELETDYAALEKEITDQTAAVAVANPNFYGVIESTDGWTQKAQDKKCLIIGVSYPIALGYMKPPVEFGADIVVGDGQALGNYMGFGGPHFGFMATSGNLIRKIPGRVVGETIDHGGCRGFCLTFQTREQHIRREKATSNICTNQALCALRGVIYLSMVGERGFKEIASQNYHKAHYLAEQFQKKGLNLISNKPFFNEFVIGYSGDIQKQSKKLEDAGFIGGLDLGKFGKQGYWMWAVTEKRSKEEMDEVVRIIQ
jgi:glycine dehydrogenase subunit 1